MVIGFNNSVLAKPFETKKNLNPFSLIKRAQYLSNFPANLQFNEFCSMCIRQFYLGLQKEYSSWNSFGISLLSKQHRQKFTSFWKMIKRLT